jgi:drug/metabolite transporter (DMT)-like permease
LDSAQTTRRAPEWQVWAALLIVYVVWGSTYLAISVVDETMPPLLAAGVRHLTAGTILFIILLIARGSRALPRSRDEWLGAGFVGLALLLGGNGLVVTAETTVPSGLTALIIAIVPLFVVLLRRVFGERVALGTYVGIAVGFAGVAVLVIPHGISGTVSMVGMLMLIGASLSWAVGTFFSKRVKLPRDPLASTGVQMLAGGGSLVLAGALAGESDRIDFADFSTASVISLLYLILFGSVLAYTAYTWLLQNTSVSRVSTYAYVNPVVAIFLGSVLLNEPIDAFIVIGAAMIVIAVIVVIRTEAQRAPSDTPTGAAEASPAASEAVIEALGTKTS